MVRGSLNVSPESWLVAASRQWQSERLCQQTISLRESEDRWCYSYLKIGNNKQCRRVGLDPRQTRERHHELTVGLVGPTWLRESIHMSPLDEFLAEFYSI